MDTRANPSRRGAGQFTGRHFAVIMVSFFGVVMAVNFAMARLASTTFGGVVVPNSYVASQNFNRWLDEAQSARALGWSASATRLADGRVAVTLAGVSGGGATVGGDARHPLGRLPDRALAFVSDGAGRFVSREALPEGRWRLRIAISASGQRWRTEMDLR